MKKVYLVHCWDGNIGDGWYPWIKNILEKSNIKVMMENMPDTQEPQIEKWVSKLDDMVDCLDEDTYFIGHSIGAQTILRYLQTKEVSKIGGILLVAPWFELLPEALLDGSDVIAAPWINTPIDFEKIRKFTTNINCIFSNNDYFVSLENEVLFKERLNTNNKIIHNKGHISAEDNIYEDNDILSMTANMLGIEWIEIIDESGNSIGEILDRNIVHEKNLLHKEVMLFIFNHKKQTLLQKRSQKKKSKPNKWALCAGHVDILEDPHDSMLRELEEELGIKVEKEKIKYFISVLKKRERNSNLSYGYYLFLNKEVSEFNIQEEELSEVKWIDFEKFKQMVLNSDPETVFQNPEEYIEVLKKLDQILQNER